MNLEEKFQEILSRIDDFKKDGFDLSLDEDLALGVMNLIATEEHLFFTWEKTKKENYYKMLLDVRNLRKELLKKLVSEHEGETWCTTKHLLSATMRFMEVGTKLQTKGDDDGAKKMFDYSNKIFSIFWALRMHLVSLKEIKETVGEDPAPMTLDDIMKRLVDCCKE